MDQKKTGEFLKKLRKEKNITQEALAEKIGVSNRTVSRWENGNNMPDWDLILQISQFYNVRIEDILSGEIKEENDLLKTEEILSDAAQHENAEKEKIIKPLHFLFAVTAVCLAVYLILEYMHTADIYPYSALCDFLKGAVFGLVLVGFVFTGRHGIKIRKAKLRLLRQFKR